MTRTEDLRGPLSDDTGAAPPPRVARSVGHSLLGTTGTRVLGALGGLLAARLLGPSLRGEYAVAFTVATISGMVATCGVQFWVVVAIGRRDDVGVVARTVRRHLAAMLVAHVLLAAAAVLWRPGGVSAWTVVGVAAFSFLSAAGMLLMAAPLAVRDLRTVAVGSAAGGATFAAGLVVLVVLDRPSVALVMIAAALGSAVTAVAGARRFHSLTSAIAARVSPVRTSARSWRPAIREFAGAGFGEVVLLGMLRIDFLLLAALLPIRDVGLYAVASSVTELLWVVPDAAAQVALPLSTEERDGRPVTRLFRLALLATALAGVALALLAPVAIPIVFGASYRHAAAAVPLLCVAAVAAGGWKILAAEAATRGDPSARLMSATTGLLAMVICDLIAVPPLGIVGASLGAAVGYSAAAMAMGARWARLPGADLGELWRFRRADLPPLPRRAGS